MKKFFLEIIAILSCITIIGCCLVACNKQEQLNVIDKNGNINQETINNLPKEELNEEQWNNALNFKSTKQIKVTSFISTKEEQDKRFVEVKFDNNLVQATSFNDKNIKIIIDIKNNFQYEYKNEKWTKKVLEEKYKNSLNIDAMLSLSGIDDEILCYSSFKYKDGQYIGEIKVDETSSCLLNLKFYKGKLLMLSIEGKLLETNLKTTFIFEYTNVDVKVPNV